MELIIISESKIKLTLTKDELESFSGNTKDVLRDIMNEAQMNCECPRLDGRVFVQMYQSKKGGCEMFVTKLEKNLNETAMRSGEERMLTEYKRSYISENGSHVIYLFTEMTNLLGCCMGLLKMGYNGSSTAYIDSSNKTYYLMLDSETHVAGENFGSLCPMRTYYYINEHCDVMCDSEAVLKLGKLA